MALDFSFPVGEIIVTTLMHRRKFIADNVTNSNAILRKLSEKGNVKEIAGGRQIFQPLEYAQNDTFAFYSGAETLDVTPAQAIIDAAQYEWKQASCQIKCTGLEVNVQNTSKEQIIDLMDVRINNAAKTMANEISKSLYSDGSGSSGKEITGLQAQVAEDPTGDTVAGIARDTYTWWQNQYSGPTTAPTSSTIEGHMMDMYLDCTRGADTPDLILADQIFYKLYWEALSSIQRIQQVDKGQRGWPNLAFIGAEVVYDGDTMLAAELSATKGRMWFLNTDYIYYCPHATVNMIPDDKRLAYDADAFIVPLLWAGNLCASNLSLQGILWDAST